MCGIAGIVNLEPGPAPEREALARMVAAQRHRGPDEQGLYCDARAGLAHARLAVVDLEGGQQPMCHAGRWIVFNGEVFNHVELRAELEARGRHFRTRSDTEVLIQAYEEWGEAALERLDGQFAFAIWDPTEERLLLARDRFGVHPLHLCRQRDRLLFASEVKALFAGAPDLPRAFDPRGLDEVFTFWGAVPPATPFAGVEELPPGHLRVYHGRQMTERAWCPPRNRDRFTGDRPAGEAAVRAALETASTRRLLRADVEVGCYLSGGLDSALVAALATATGRRLRTFSVRFEDAHLDEGVHQRLVATRLGSIHHERVVTTGDIARVFPDVVRHAERPLLRTAPAPLFLLSQIVREAGLKVVLTGEGADEVFAGYDLFREAAVRRFWARQPASPHRPRLLERLYPYLARSPVAHGGLARHFFGQDLAGWRNPGFGHGLRWRTTRALQRLFRRELVEPARDVVGDLLAGLPAELPSWSPLAQDQYLETRTLLAGYLLSAQGDRMLMAHAVEGRFPFLSPAVAALAESLPDRWRLCGLDEKHILKRVAADLVPESVRRRPKQPYRAPDAACFFGPSAPDWVGEVLGDRAVRDAGVFEPAAVARLVAKCRARGGQGLSNSDNMAVVGVISTQLLHATLLAPAPQVVPAPIAHVIDRVIP